MTKAKITFLIEEEEKRFLNQWAKLENRSLSSLIEGITKSAIAIKKAGGTSALPTIAALVKQWDLEKLAAEARLPIEEVEFIANGSRPNDEQVIALGRILSFNTEELLKIRMRDFPRGNGVKTKRNK
ncbi:MAG: hypothetical protein F6K58_32195 [Symploca sp. SIO2E9]|nr:hypothetical protein [Symploca sp. SIO2E9]